VGAGEWEGAALSEERELYSCKTTLSDICKVRIYFVNLVEMLKCNERVKGEMLCLISKITD